MMRTKLNLLLIVFAVMLCNLGNYSCMPTESCKPGFDTSYYNIFSKNSSWDNFVQIKQYDFKINIGNIIENVKLNSNGENIKKVIKYVWNSGGADCSTSEYDCDVFKEYNYFNGNSSVLKIVSEGASQNTDNYYDNDVQLTFLNSVFYFRTNDLLSIYRPSYLDSIMINSKWIYNVYKLKSSDTSASLYLNYQVGIIKYEKGNLSWTNNNW